MLSEAVTCGKHDVFDEPARLVRYTLARYTSRTMNTLSLLLEEGEAAGLLRNFIDAGGDVVTLGGGPGFEVKAVFMYEMVRDRVGARAGEGSCQPDKDAHT